MSPVRCGSMRSIPEIWALRPELLECAAVAAQGDAKISIAAKNPPTPMWACEHDTVATANSGLCAHFGHRADAAQRLDAMAARAYRCGRAESRETRFEERTMAAAYTELFG
jgi:hypothetical protein